VEEFVAVLVERVGELVGNAGRGMGVEFESRYRMRASQEGRMGLLRVRRSAHWDYGELAVSGER
jgi:hypothetical protein